MEVKMKKPIFIIFFTMLISVTLSGCGVTPCDNAKAEWTNNSSLKQKVRQKKNKMTMSEQRDWTMKVVNCYENHQHSWR
jgi:hypothetical protein